MTITEIEQAAGDLAKNARNSEVQELAELVRQLAHEGNESLEFLVKTKLDMPSGMQTADELKRIQL